MQIILLATYIWVSLLDRNADVILCLFGCNDMYTMYRGVLRYSVYLGCNDMYTMYRGVLRYSVYLGCNDMYAVY